MVLSIASDFNRSTTLAHHTFSESEKVPFVPAVQTFSAHVVRSANGGAWGMSKNHVFFEGMMVPDPDMNMILVDVTSNGGNIHAIGPDAGSGSLAQGVHVGLSVWATADFALTYWITMPVGISPRTITDKADKDWGTASLIWIKGQVGWLFT